MFHVEHLPGDIHGLFHVEQPGHSAIRTRVDA